MRADDTLTREARTKGPVRFDDIAESWRREQPELAMDDLLLSICLTRLGRMLDARYHRRCQDRFGVSGADLRVLLALRRAGRPYARRPTDLFRALIVTSGAITKQVDRLLAKGLVARMQDPLHDGGFLVHLTPKGLKLVNAALVDLAADATLAGAMAQLSPREREAGIRFCTHLIRQLEQQPSD